MTSTNFEADPPFPEGDKRRFGYSREGAGDASAAVEAAVGPAQATLDHAADARGTADETRRSARSVPQSLAPGGDRGGRRQRHAQLPARSQEAAASAVARRPVSAAH